MDSASSVRHCISYSNMYLCHKCHHARVILKLRAFFCGIRCRTLAIKHRVRRVPITLIATGSSAIRVPRAPEARVVTHECHGEHAPRDGSLSGVHEQTQDPLEAATSARPPHNVLQMLAITHHSGC